MSGIFSHGLALTYNERFGLFSVKTIPTANILYPSKEIEHYWVSDLPTLLALTNHRMVNEVKVVAFYNYYRHVVVKGMNGVEWDLLL